jgi:hypothetical protein
MSVQHPDMATQLACDPATLIEELKRICVEQLGAVPGGLYRPIEEQLHDSLRVGGDSAHRKDLMAVLALRQRGSGYVMRYRELIGRSFDDFCGRAAPGKQSAPMGLVRENELEFHLAGQRLAESIARRYQRPLEMLGLRFEALAASLGMPSGRNPVGANLLADAFVQTFGDADISPALQALLFRQYEQELAKVLGELYGRLNTQLAANGFHADTRREPSMPAAPASVGPEQHRQASVADPLERILSQVEPRTRAQAPPMLSPTGAFPESGGRAGAGEQSAGAVPGNADRFRVAAGARVQHQQMRDMLRMWRDGMLGEQSLPAGIAPERRMGERRALRMQEVVSVASLLQGDGTRNFEAALAGKCGLHEAIREELREGARRLGLDPDQTCLDTQQEDAVDMTGLLFESLINSHALAQESRRMFTRLVMSYVKVALTDENLFVRPEHPARRLLDALAQGCEGNEGTSPQERELLQASRAAVERVVAEFNEDLAIFDLAANELQDLLQQQQRRAEVVERRASETVHGRERLVDARTRAAAALARHLEGRNLTATVSHFLARHWQHHLVQVLLRDGEGSERHRHVIELASELVALDEAAARGGEMDIADRVLSLHDGLVECLSSSGLDEQVASEWMAGLARTLAFPDVPRERATVPAAPVADEDESPLLRVVGGTDRLDFDPAVAERMRALRPGDWMRLSDDRGVEGSVKVAWISPLTSRLLLVNRRGVRQLVAAPEQLAALVRSGHLFAEADELPFDEAMRLVRQKLSRAATRAA